MDINKNKSKRLNVKDLSNLYKYALKLLPSVETYPSPLIYIYK